MNGLGLALSAAAAWASGVGQQNLTLEEALRIAEGNAFSLKLQASQVEKARQQVNLAKGQIGPKLNAEATYTRFDKAATTTVAPGQTITTQPIDNRQAQVTLAWPLDLFGVLGKSISASRNFLEAQENLYEAQRNDLHLEVKRAFYQVLQARAQVKVAQEAVTRAEEQLRVARAQFEADVVARLDVLRFETQLSQAQSDLISVGNSLQLAKNLLNNVLGRPIETPFEPSEVERTPIVRRSPDELVELAMQSRPELDALKNNIEAFRFVREGEERGMTPSVNVSAVHTRNFGTGGFSSQRQQTYGVLSLSVPLFDSGLTRSRVKQARQDEVQAEIQLQQTSLGVSLEVRQAWNNLDSADARLTVAEKQVELAVETLRLARIKFEAGEGIPLEVTEAQTEVTRAQTQLVTARYDYLRALAEVQRAVGVETVGAPPQNQVGEDK